MEGNANPTPRRVGLTILFVLWLSIQAAVIGLTPAWGFILPHEHVLRGMMTEADWEQHMAQHRLGVFFAYTPNCTVPSSQSPRVAESVPDLNGALSVLSFVVGNVDAGLVILRTPQTRPTAYSLSGFYAFDIFDIPLEPPPNI